MAALFVVGYLLAGVAVTIWFLTGIIRTKLPIEYEDGTYGERRVIRMMSPRILVGFLLFLLTLGPISMATRAAFRMAVHLFSGTSDNEEDPQERVPPEYR